MTKYSKNSGNALPLILGIVLLAAIGIGGWMYMKKQTPSETVDQALNETRTPAETPAPVEPQPATTPEPTAEAPVLPAPETTTAETAPAATTETASIDIAKATSTRAIGNPNAPIKIIEYASLTCSHCAHFHNDVLPELKTKYIDTGKVYLQFIEFPLNDPALKATLTARCLPEDKYDGFVSLLFKSQDRWAGGLDYMAALRQNAKLAGMSDATFEACQNSDALKQFVAKNMQTAQDKWKIDATPTFIINEGAERISGAQPLPEFERIFDKLSGGKIGEAPKVE